MGAGIRLRNGGGEGFFTTAGMTTDGFLLAELLVALAILALVSGFAVRALSGAYDWLDRNRHAATALAIAQATLDRVGNDIPLGRSETGGSTADTYTWQVAITPYQDAPIATAVPVGLYRVQVTVGWHLFGMPRQVQLSTLRLGRVERGG